jgi:MFS family permease
MSRPVTALAPPPAPVGPPAAVAASLAATEREAGLTAVMSGLTEPFMVPYALALGATSFEAGCLSSVRNLALALVQLFSADAVGRLGSRRSVVLWTVGVQAALWLPLALAGPLLGRWAVAGLVAGYTLATASAALGAPAWGSLVAEYLPAGERGRFFGLRARTVGLWTTLASLAAGGVLQVTAGRPWLGFGLLCIAAGASRLAAWRWLARLHEEPWREEPHRRFSFWQFVRKAPRSNFARFSLSIAGLSFATHVAAPYFAIYMLRELHYGYLVYTGVVLAGSVTGFLASPWWGRIGDARGNHAVLRWTVVGVTVLPALWTLSGHPAWMATLNLTGAFLWGGLNLSASNFLYDAVTPAKRHTCLAYFNVLNGLGVSLGALAGGWALGALPALGGSPFLTVFCASAVLRALAALAFHRFVREVRPVRQLALREIVLDLVGQRLVSVLGFEVERRVRPGAAPAPPARSGATARDAARRA